MAQDNSQQKLSISDITNTPLEFDILGKKYLVKKIGINKLYSDLETAIKQEYKDEVKELSDLFVGKEKFDFVKKSMNDMPTGEDLMAKCMARMDSNIGRKHILRLALAPNKLSEEQLSEIYDNIAIELFSEIVNYAMNSLISKKEEVVDNEVKKEELPLEQKKENQ